MKYVVGTESWEKYEERDEEFEEGCEKHSFLSLMDVFGSESFLYDVLVTSPIANVGEQNASEYSCYSGHVAEGFWVV